MSTADTALSISIKMAPGPEHRQEPVAPDKIAESDRTTNADAAVAVAVAAAAAAAAAADVVIDIENISATSTTGSGSNNNNNNNINTDDDDDSVAAAVAAAVITAEQNSNIEIAPANFTAVAADSISEISPSNSGADNKQDEPATLSMLNDNELRALLDEAITYKRPKDREGKSNLFKELLQEAEADETEEGRRVISNSRCLPGSNRRRHKRESVSERLTHGGSLQNLAQPITSEFDSSFAYLTSSSCHTYGSSRRKNKKYTGPSVSARQREGGSLPSNVNASHNLASLANLDLIFDKKKSFCEERPAYDWTNKEKSKSLDKSSYTSTKKEEKEKDKKELKRDTANSGEVESEVREKRISKGKYGTNEMLESDNPPPEYKSDYMVIDLGDVESLDTENDEGTELKIIEPRKPIHYVTRATFDITQTPVDTTIEFPIRDHKQEKSKMSVNGTEVTGTLFQPHNSVKCGISGTSTNSSSTSQNKIVPGLCTVMPPSWQPQNITMVRGLCTEGPYVYIFFLMLLFIMIGVNIALRRPKQRSTGDATVDSRGDRRSWGTEEGQSIYCNDTGEDYTSRRNSNKKINPEPEHETEFLVVTKKKKSKKQRRSSSGSRAQNLTTSGSYLQNSRGFSNDYRTPLSPELRRKSASSMPPSDKSADSSDLDSVHSLPVTSNTSKHNLSKVATSSGGTPQASYADIARMATINMSHNLTMSAMLNTSSWPSVPPKTLSEPDKVPQDYYPSLDELQHSEKKARQQQNLAQSNHAAATLSLAFEKPLSPTLTKMKNSSDRKKAEAQEEAINKNIQVFKYVQDIEKMHESLTQATEHKEQKHVTPTNYNTNPNETNTITNTIMPRYNNNSTTMNYNPVDADNNPNCSINNKDSVTHPRASNSRSRRNYVHSNQNVQTQGSHEEHIKKTTTTYHEEAVKKSHNADVAQSERTNPIVVSHDGAEAQKLKTAKIQDTQNVEPESGHNKMTSGDLRTIRVAKEYQNITMKHDATKVGVCQPQNSKQDNQQRDDAENKKAKSQNVPPEKDQSQRSSTETQQAKNSTPRPAVILLDETSSDVAKNNNLPTELTFGFEINEQLLLSEDNGNEEIPTITANPAFPPTISPLVNKPPNNFERNPPLFAEKPVRYDKFSSSYHMQPPNAHVTPANAHPVTPVHPVMVQPLPYMSYPTTRFAPPTYLPPPPPPPPGIMEKFHPPKEDFSMLYVAPEEELNVQTYNHDKIVSFVGLAWDAVMREMPVTATGRIQFYSGQ
ncbi:uncharacterized protein LOC105424276 [Pogonomyrmex barbatus]|uniref:Uncharacterized protein LOC105424276 n=1 Tax=Pogonomyrmex barbatus TaxID=144034 RepID=A0A6I9VUG2_9HYME|nr:uncharacterized protein LOC105424276 [Pogonomyrmex barbatus]